MLSNHYAHWHCSPSRRSFLTGRLPVHHGEQLSPDDDDDIDLRMSWVSDKLAEAGYEAHWFGKWHTGFRSVNHLGTNHGFKTALGSFQTGGAYAGPEHTMRWQNDHPIWNDAQFVDPPPGCGDIPSPPASSPPACNASSFLNNTRLRCGSLLNFVNVSTAEECCAACKNETHCSHWVFAPDNTVRLPCHLKSGTVPHDCIETANQSTSGINSTPTPPARNANCTNEYSTDLWGQAAVQTLNNYVPSSAAPLYMHLCFEAVHTPYDNVPGWPNKNRTDTYHGMLWRADLYIGKIIELLKAKGMWDNTLILYAADNGGTVGGINFPLRGEKHSNWEGGMRAASFLSGGFLPAAVRGTNNTVNMHLADWHPTFCALSGHSDCTDNPPVAPLPADPSNPLKDLYGEDSYPPLDGVNVWPLIVKPEGTAPDAAHKHLVLSKEVLIAGQWKLLVSQPHFKSQEAGWKTPDGVWHNPTGSEVVPCQMQDVAPDVSALPVPADAGASPCLFDLRADPVERNDVASANPDVVASLWAALNTTVAGQRDCQGWSYVGTSAHIPGPAQPDGTWSCSPPAKLGVCNTTCAEDYWESSYGDKEGPVCGLSMCS